MRGGWQQPLPDMPAPPPARAWRRLEAPEGYPQQWRRLAEAALELGLGPEQLGETGLEPLAAARGWKPATVALYSKVARYGGIALPSAPTPEPDPPALDLRPLTGIRSEDPEHLRAVAWCALALAWPAPVGHFRSLRREQVRATTRRLLISTDDGEWAVPGALTAWHTWETVRGRFPALAASPWVLPALRRGPGFDSAIGGRLSNQALQVTFAKHAVRTAQHLRATTAPSRRNQAEELAHAYQRLSYDSFRRLALAAGAPPVSARGVVRAARAVARSSRLAGRASPPSDQLELFGRLPGCQARVGSCVHLARRPLIRRPGPWQAMCRQASGREAHLLVPGHPCHHPGVDLAGRPALLPIRPVSGQRRRHPPGQPAAVLGRDVGPACVQLPVSRQQLGVRAAQPGHEPLTGPRPQVQRDDGDSGGARGGDRADRDVQGIDVIGEAREDRREEHAAGQTGVGDRADQFQARSRRRDPRLQGAVQVVVPDGDGDAEADGYLPRRLGEQREVAT